MKVLVAQLGARRHYAIPRILDQAGLLSKFVTDIHAESRLVRAARWCVPQKLQPGGLKRLSGRLISGVNPRRVSDFSWFGISRILKSRTARTTAQQYAAWIRDNREFGNSVCRRGFGDADTVYVFNGAGLEIMRLARQQGLKCILEQTAADQSYDEQLLQRERELWPEWETDSVQPEDWRLLSEREQQERQLADLVICGSDYVKESIRIVGERNDHCRVVPYGFTTDSPPIERSPKNAKINVLFAGTLCLRKGIPYLLEAASDESVRRFMNFRFVGPSLVSATAMERIQSVVEWLGPVPRRDMRSQYAWADVFVLPTISEGSANVCYEALNAGLPVVTTTNAGSVVRDSVDGFVVPIRDSEMLRHRLIQLACDASLRHSMSEAAIERSREYTWSRYAERLLSVVRSLD